VRIGTDIDWSSASSVYNHTCATKTNHTLYCWGSNNNGELGLGNTTYQVSPTQVGSDTNWSAVSAGKYFTCGTKTTGTLFCWGTAAVGQLGIGSTTDQDHPVQVGTGSYWTSVSAGGYQAAGLRTGGGLYTWGANGDGQLGRNPWWPQQVAFGDLPATNRDGSPWSLTLLFLAGLTAAASVGLRVRPAKRT
jgi:alpha-tubulin suppressor-like RCC1 family protein